MAKRRETMSEGKKNIFSALIDVISIQRRHPGCTQRSAGRNYPKHDGG
jgi:hypothetical protein